MPEPFVRLFLDSHPSRALPDSWDKEADSITRFTRLVATSLCALTGLITMPPRLIMRPLGSLLNVLTFGLYGKLYSLILWGPVCLLLMTTSLLWFHFWPIRPALMPVGPVLAAAGALVINLSPPRTTIEGFEALAWELSFACAWPYTMFLVKAWDQGAGSPLLTKEFVETFDDYMAGKKS